MPRAYSSTINSLPQGRPAPQLAQLVHVLHQRKRHRHARLPGGGRSRRLALLRHSSTAPVSCAAQVGRNRAARFKPPPAAAGRLHSDSEPPRARASTGGGSGRQGSNGGARCPARSMAQPAHLQTRCRAPGCALAAQLLPWPCRPPIDRRRARTEPDTTMRPARPLQAGCCSRVEGRAGWRSAGGASGPLPGSGVMCEASR